MDTRDGRAGDGIAVVGMTCSSQAKTPELHQKCAPLGRGIRPDATRPSCLWSKAGDDRNWRALGAQEVPIPRLGLELEEAEDTDEDVEIDDQVGRRQFTFSKVSREEFFQKRQKARLVGGDRLRGKDGKAGYNWAERTTCPSARNARLSHQRSITRSMRRTAAPDAEAPKGIEPGRRAAAARSSYCPLR